MQHKASVFKLLKGKFYAQEGRNVEQMGAKSCMEEWPKN